MKTKSKWFNILMVIIVVIMLLSFLLSFEPVAKVVADTVGKPIQAVKDFAKTVLLVAIGAFLITSGVAAMAVPVLGAALIIVGLGLMWWGLAPIFQSGKTYPTIPPNQ